MAGSSLPGGDGAVQEPLLGRRMVAVPTASLSWNTSPARTASMIAGVPPSSRCAGSSR